MTATEGRLAGAVKRMGERQPAVRLQIRMMSVPLQLAALRENQIDVAFIRPPVADPGLSSQLLVSEPFVAALPSRHCLRVSKQIRLPALAGEPFPLSARERAAVLRPDVANLSGVGLRPARAGGG